MVDPDVVFPTRYMAVAMNIPAVLFFFLGGELELRKGYIQMIYVRLCERV